MESYGNYGMQSPNRKAESYSSDGMEEYTGKNSMSQMPIQALTCFPGMLV